MLNNITNFFNLIQTGMVKSQLESADLLPIGTRDSRYGGNYKPTMIKYSDLAAQILAGVPPLTIGTTPIVSGTVGRVLFEGTGNVVQESANLFWDNTNSRLSIGANSPTSKLFVRADGASGLTQPFRVETSASRLLLQTEDGGTTRIGGPTARLYVNVESGGIAHTLVVNGSVHFGGGIGNAGANFFDSGGTSSASRIIQYDGSGSLKNLITSNGASYIQGGNFLINTTTDAGFKLDVNGTARVVGSMLVQGMTVGLGGGAVAQSVAIGKEALQANTTYQNCAVGYRALYNTTGGDNTAVGAFYAMFANTTGGRNTGIGSFALNGNTTGQYNTAIGYNTSSGNFSNSTILGYGAAASADNQFVVGSSAVNAGAVTSEVNASTQVWNVIINGVARKILLA